MQRPFRKEVGLKHGESPNPKRRTSHVDDDMVYSPNKKYRETEGVKEGNRFLKDRISMAYEFRTAEAFEPVAIFSYVQLPKENGNISQDC